MTNQLKEKKCVPCEGDVKPLSIDQAYDLLKEVSSWTLDCGNKKISKKITFNNFVEAVAFVNKVADIAENENHHPDIFIHGYKNVDITLSTHAIHGLSENDFIVAAKVDQIT